MHTFTTVSKLVTGAGCFDQLGELAKQLGRRALVVTGRRSMRRAGLTDRACGLLQAAGVEVLLFEDVSREPSDADVDAGRARCRAERCGLVIGIGGGSAMDAAKSIAALANADAPTAEYIKGRPADARDPLPCIAVATTSGTGAEVTPNAVLSWPGGRLKASIRGAGILPTVALVDPDLTLTCPPGVTAASGMDALTQAIESYVSIHATPLTEALSLHAAELMLANLPEAYAHGDNRAAREGCAYGSTMAGIALANARLGVVHGIAHPLGIRCHIPHGVCCAALLPASIRLNRTAAAAKYDRLSQVAGADIEKVAERLLTELGLDRAFGEYEINERDLPEIARESMPSGSLKANPKKVTEEDVLNILSRCLPHHKNTTTRQPDKP